MKKRCLIPLIACMATAASAQAALLSLYTFDQTMENAVPNVVGGIAEGYEGRYQGPQFSVTDGPIRGGKALKFDGFDDSLNLGIDTVPRTSVYGEESKGIWTGSCSFWIKTDMCKGERMILGAACLGDNTTFEILLQDGRLLLHAEAADSTPNRGLFQARQADEATSCCDNNWHQVVLTWNLTTGQSGTGTSAVYVDGIRQPVNIPHNGITSTHKFSAWNYPLRLGSLGRDVVYPDYYLHGVLDDLAVWNEMLSEAKVLAIFNLSQDSMFNFGVREVQDLCEILDEGPGAQGVVGGIIWQYQTGLSGSPGQVVENHNAVVLDAQGNGVRTVLKPDNNTPNR